MRAEAVELIEDDGRVTGVRADTPDGALSVRTDLTVGCDGRHSTVRARAGLAVKEFGAPMDVLWFRLPKKANDPAQTMGRFEAGRISILIDRGDYWQCAFLIPKGSIDDLRRSGLPAFRLSVAQLVPAFADRVDGLEDWDEIKLLTVAVNRLERWYRPGLLCIGDAAHAMSPIGGVGVNLAVQDAVATANILWQPLANGTLREDNLAEVQERREFPTRVTQRMQVFMQDKVISRMLPGGQTAGGAAAGAVAGALRAAAAHPGTAGGNGRAARACAHARNSRLRSGTHGLTVGSPAGSVAVGCEVDGGSDDGKLSFRALSSSLSRSFLLRSGACSVPPSSR